MTSPQVADSREESGLLLIRGLGHSGTTLLDLALGSHPQILGLGEVARLVRRPERGEEGKGPARLRGDGRFERRCTCGAVAADCPIWGEYLDWLRLHDHLSDLEKFMALIGRAQTPERVGGSDAPAAPLRWVVESYQADVSLPGQLKQALHPRPVKVILLVRDVRSWVHSEARRGKSRRHYAALRAVLRWWRVNRRLERELKDSGCDLLTLGYEELALAPAETFQLLCAWLGLNYDKRMLTPGAATRSHIVSGNRVRYDRERTSRISYDGTWLSSSSLVMRAALAWPPLAAMNRRLVYGQMLLGQSWPHRPS
jgi:hypothetical protein